MEEIKSYITKVDSDIYAKEYTEIAANRFEEGVKKIFRDYGFNVDEYLGKKD